MHYRIGPSKLARNMACPASFKLEEQYPDTPGGPAAVDGTHSHTLLESCINQDLMDPMLMMGQVLFDHEGAFEVDVERAKRVNVAIQYLRRRKGEMGICGIRAEEISDPGAFHGWDDWKGTCDVTLVGNDMIEIMDYKDGRTPVKAEENEQLMSYALGRALEYQLPQEFRVRLTIIQPRVDPAITCHDVTVADLYQFAAEVHEWRKVAESDDAPYVPGEKQCRWCKAKGDCKAFNTEALKGVDMHFQNIEIANQAADKEPSQMTDEQLAQFIEGIPLIKQAIAAAEEEALRRFEAGHKVPGLKAVRGRGQRAWAYDEEEMADKLKRMGIPKKALYVTKLVSPAQAEKVTWEKRDGTRKTLSQRQLNTLNKEYIKKQPGKIRIVSEAADGEAVELGVSHLFQPIENETPAWLAGVEENA